MENSLKVIALDSARPREQRLTELQQEIAFLRCAEVSILNEAILTVVRKMEVIRDSKVFHPGIRDDMGRTAEHMRFFVARMERLNS
jgi:hypothetical protein